MQICNKCKIEKPLAEYEKAKTCKNGHRRTCRKCVNERKKIHLIKCSQCNIIFKSAKKSAKYCGAACVGKSKQIKEVVICEYCGKDKEIIPSLLENVEVHYCNQNCRTKHMGKIMLGTNNPNYNRVEHSCDGCDEVIMVIPSQLKSQLYIFCSNECYKNNIGQYFSTVNNNNWNHSLTDEDRRDLRRYPDYYKWREDVYARDNYTCQHCGDNKGGNLIAHHIYNYSTHKELRTVLTNGITLCELCHGDYHKTYGYKNNNEFQLNEYMNKKALS